MKSAKKRIALLLAVVMLFTLCACGKKKALNGEWTLTFVPSAMGFDQLLPFEGFTAQGTITVPAPRMGIKSSTASPSASSRA